MFIWKPRRMIAPFNTLLMENLIPVSKITPGFRKVANSKPIAIPNTGPPTIGIFCPRNHAGMAIVKDNSNPGIADLCERIFNTLVIRVAPFRRTKDRKIYFYLPFPPDLSYQNKSICPVRYDHGMIKKQPGNDKKGKTFYLPEVKEMLNYQRAASADYELFFTRFQEEAADYLEHSLCLLQVTLVEFKHLLQLLVWWWLYRPYICIST